MKGKQKLMCLAMLAVLMWVILKAFDGPRVFSARRSGDEFITLAWGFASEEEGQHFITALWERICQEDMTLPNGSSYKLRVSAGVSRYPKDSTDLAELREPIP